MEDIGKILNSLAEYTAQFFFIKHPEKDCSGINCVSDIRPGVLQNAEVLLNCACVEKAEILNGKLIIYARDPMLLADAKYSAKGVWEFIQQHIQDSYGLLLAIGKFDDDFSAPIEPIPYTTSAWQYLGPHLRDLSWSFGKDGYFNEMIRIFGQ